uniref:Condensation domain-containing protein n=1 Tax=Stigmatella aurantiaca Sg a15 TaxID=675526 RepID=A0A097DC76_STIAU|nr:condensation domain-containing protein [Stigmatella aurantiaca Sg a15]
MGSSDRTSERQAPGAYRTYPLPAHNLFYLYQLITLGNLNSCELLELDGRLDHERLRAALLQALARHPVLNSRLKPRFMRGFDIELIAKPLPLDLRFERCDTDEPGVVHQRLLRNVWQESFDVTVDRPVRFHLLETPSKSYLQIITVRLYNDAKAGYRLAHDVAESYTALEFGQPFDATPIQVVDRSTSGLLTSHLPLREKLRHSVGAVKLFAQDFFRPDVSMPLPDTPRGDQDFMKVDFGAELLEGLRRRAKQEKVTVHAMLALAMFKVWRASAPSKVGRRWLRILDNFSLRHMTRENADELYETLVVPYSVRLPTSGSDKEVLHAMVEQLNHWKSGEILSELYRVRLYAALSRFSPLKLSSAFITRYVAKSNIVMSNPGPVPYPLERFGSVPIADFINFSQLFPPSRVMLIFSTFRGRLRALVVWDRNAYPNGPERELIAPLKAQLAALATPAADAAPAAAAQASR